MKCVCGYEHTHGIDDNGNYKDNLIGDTKFLSLHGSFFKINEGFMEDRIVSLYACPKMWNY